MTKRKRYLLCGHGESLPMAEDGATSLSSVLEDLAVEVCARRSQLGGASTKSISISCGCRAAKGGAHQSRGGLQARQSADGRLSCDG